MATLIIIALFITIFIVGARYVAIMENEKEVEILKQEYSHALQSGDKQVALNAGRIYYSRLRKGNLSIYDEQAIANDLAVMK